MPIDHGQPSQLFVTLTNSPSQFISLRPHHLLTSATITYYLIWKGANASMNSDEFINDPRHPRFAAGGKFIDLEKRD